MVFESGRSKEPTVKPAIPHILAHVLLLNLPISTGGMNSLHKLTSALSYELPIDDHAWPILALHVDIYIWALARGRKFEQSEREDYDRLSLL